MKNWQLCLIVCSFFLFLGFCILLRVAPVYEEQTPIFTYAEKLTVSLETTEEVYSQYEYNEWVYFRISGLGVVGEDVYSDDFCRYDEQGNGVSGYFNYTYGIAVDKVVRLLDITEDCIGCAQTMNLPLPSSLTGSERCYSQSHVYIIGYYVREGPRRISFNSVDPTVEDNSGEITVEISSQRPPNMIGGR